MLGVILDAAKGGFVNIDLSNLISSIGAIVAAWFSYNQYTKNKVTDAKVEAFKERETQRSYKRSENSAKIFGELWRVLFELKADRVYIVQPHPLGHPMYLSIQFEVKRKGVMGMRESVQKLPMSDIAVFSRELAENLYMYIEDIDEQVDDRVAKALLSSNGCVGAIIKRLNSPNDWVGSIFCEFTSPMEVSEEEARSILHEAATVIQYILPDIADFENLNKL